MAGRPCVSCGATVVDLYVCQLCLDEYRDRLHSVRWLAEELEVSLSRQARITTDESGVRAASAEQPLPFGWGASEALYLLDSTLTQWADQLAHQHNLPRDPPPELPTRDPRDPARIRARRHRATATAAWLTDHADTLPTFPDAEDLIEAVTYAVRSGFGTVDRPAEMRFAGPCNADITDDDGTVWTCTEDLYGRPGAPTIDCRRCGTEHDVGVRRAYLLDQASSSLVTAAEATRSMPGLLGQPVTTVKIGELVRTGRVTAHPPLPGTTAHLFRHGDLVDALVAEQADTAIAATRKREPSGVQHVFTAAEAERALRIPAATVRSWARRQRIFPIRTDENGDPVYDKNELIGLHGNRGSACA